jgi:hypothetical protein
MNKLNKIKNNLFLLILTSLLFVPSVYAASNLVDFLGRGTSAFYDLVNNFYFIHFLTFILMFIIFYSVYAVSIKNTKLFGGLDKSGKAVAISLSLMSTIGIFSYLSLGNKIVSFFQGGLGKTGLWGILGLILFLVLLNFKGFSFSTGSWNMKSVMIISGLILLFLGSNIKNDEVVWAGFLLFVLGIIFLIWGIGDGTGGTGGGWSWPRRETTPRASTGTTGGSPSESVTSPNFNSELDSLRDKLDQYNTAFEEHKTKCNNLLTENNNHALGGPPPVPTRYDEVDTTWDDITGKSDHINHDFLNINNNVEFPRMIATDLTRFSDMTTRWMDYLVETNNYRRDFIRRLGHDEGPI